MFKVTQEDSSVDYSLSACFVKLAANGCYIPCSEEEADGVCVKKYVTKEVPTEDGGEETEAVSGFEDTVYRFGEGLKNTEPICEIAERDDAELFAEFKEDGEEIAKLKTAISILSQERLIERYSAFEVGKEYAVGTLLMHDGVLFTVLQAHTSQEGWTPVDAPSLFAEVLSSKITGEIPEWVQPDSTNAYMIGDRVIFNGVIYESIIDNNVWSPEAYPAGWVAVIE